MFKKHFRCVYCHFAHDPRSIHEHHVLLFTVACGLLEVNGKAAYCWSLVAVSPLADVDVVVMSGRLQTSDISVSKDNMFGCLHTAEKGVVFKEISP